MFFRLCEKMNMNGHVSQLVPTSSRCSISSSKHTGIRNSELQMVLVKCRMNAIIAKVKDMRKGRKDGILRMTVSAYQARNEQQTLSTIQWQCSRTYNIDNTCAMQVWSKLSTSPMPRELSSCWGAQVCYGY